MAATVRETIAQLLESTRQVIDELLALPADELALPSSHTCAQGKDLWALITNDIDHETIHAGQVLEARYEARSTASPMERLAGEWLVARAKLISTFIGMSDAEFNSATAADGWTYRGIAKHVVALDQDSLRAVREDVAQRG